MHNATNNDTTNSDVVAYLIQLSGQLRYFHLCVYFQGGIGALCGLMFLRQLGKPFARYSYPPTVRIWFICLSFTDIVSLLGYSYLMFYNHKTRRGDVLTAVIDFLNTVSDVFNVAVQVGVSIERVLVLKWELKSRYWISSRCVKRWLLVSFSFGVVNSAAAIMSRWYLKGSSQLAWIMINFMLLILFVTVMVASSIAILILMRQKAGERTSLLADRHKLSTISQSASTDMINKTRRAATINQEIHIALRLLGANALFIACYVPYFALATWRSALTFRKTPSPLIDIVQHLFTPVLRYNNSFNWIPIYLCNKSFRQNFNPLKPCRKIDI